LQLVRGTRKGGNTVKYVTYGFLRKHDLDTLPVYFRERFGERATIKDFLAWIREQDSSGYLNARGFWESYCLSVNDAPFVQALIDAGADVHVRDDAAIWYAASRGHLEAVDVLIANGADVHAHNNEALFSARWNGHADVVALLCRAMAA